MMQPYGWDHMNRFDWFASTLMFVIAVLILLAIIYVVTKLLSESRTRGMRTDDQDHAISILRERYARGEIDAEEYEQARARLDDSGRRQFARSK